MSGKHYVPFAVLLRTRLSVWLQLLLSLLHFGFCFVYWTFAYMAGEQKWFFLLLYGLSFTLFMSLLIYFLTPAYKTETLPLTRKKLVLLIINWLEGGLLLICYLLPYRYSAVVTGSLLIMTLFAKLLACRNYTKCYNSQDTIQDAICTQLADARLIGWMALLPLWVYLAALGVIAQPYWALGLGALLFILSLIVLHCRYRLAKQQRLIGAGRMLVDSLLMLIPFGTAFTLSQIYPIGDRYPLVAAGCGVLSLTTLLTNLKLIQHYRRTIKRNRSVAK